jgi:hypothetical protein
MSRAVLLLSLASASLMLSACVVAPYGPPHRGPVYVPAPVVVGPAPVIVAPAPPPPPYVEVRPVVPFPGAIWIGGYWGWNAGRHVWIGGRWAPPRPGYRWEPHHWDQDGDRWHLRGGEWRER